MGKRSMFIAALILLGGAAIFFAAQHERGGHSPARRGFVSTSGSRFLIDGQPYRFVGANAALMYREEDRARMPETLHEASRNGISLVRVWAHGEGGEDSPIKSIGGDRDDWPRQHPFRTAPGQWNEAAFVHLDRVLAEAARQNLRVQLCLTNWWRDTGGVSQYLNWVGIDDAADTKFPYGINEERAVLFYSNEETRRLYREHVEKIVTRRNTVTGVLYRDDPTIMSYELINEGKALMGSWGARRAWVAEMSAYIKSLDPYHLVTPGIWGYRTAFERREWLEVHRIPTVDFCDVHHYPRDDHDSSVESPQALREFIDNRAAAAFSLNKPLVLGEFGMAPEGFKGSSEAEWFRAYFEHAARAGAGGALFWIWTPDPKRGYGVSYTTPRDEPVRAEISRAAELFASLKNERPPRPLLDAGHHLIPRQFAFTRPETDAARPDTTVRDDGTLLYRFKPEMAASARFEKIGGGEGYIWGAGVGHIEYDVPARDQYRRVGSIVVRAYIQPVLPDDAPPLAKATRVTLLVNGRDCGSRLIPPSTDPGQPIIQQWNIDSWAVRLRAVRGQPLAIRFAVELDADNPFGVNISNWPEGYDARGAKPVEVEVR